VGACGLYGGKEKFIQGFGGGVAEGKNHFEDLGVNGRIILK
jgi:hypothetical protein